MKSATIKKDIGKNVFLKSLVNVPELVTDRLTPGNWETNVLCRVARELSRAGVDPLELVHVVYMVRE